jgi:hypothetical protein
MGTLTSAQGMATRNLGVIAQFGQQSFDELHEGAVWSRQVPGGDKDSISRRRSSRS